ncbi:MAG: excinuclease ABC subunit UvrC [Myxococcota bacterium]
MPSRRARPSEFAEPPVGMEALGAELRARIEALPREPGVYLLKDRKGKVVYVGKAADLHARVRSYFARSGDTRGFVSHLGRVLGGVETIVTRSEKEALLLENNLIKLHRPKFNVLLRDDKTFLSLRLDPRGEWPRVELVRRRKQDGALYFGPYHSATSARATLRVLNRHFQLRTCSDRMFASRKRPCLQYFIKRCPAPCVYEVDAAAYQEQVGEVALFLGGKRAELVLRLRAQMKEAAAALDFEHAAHLRDRVAAVARTLEAQRVVLPEREDLHIVGFHRAGTTVNIAVVQVREGKLLSQRAHRFTRQEAPDAEIVSHFLAGLYQAGEPIPDVVVLPVAIEDRAALVEWLSEKRGRRVEITVPQRGARRELCDIAMRNAEAAAQAGLASSDEIAASLESVQARLRLGRLPRRIECVDISHLQGVASVGSLVALQDGEPDKSGYKRFKLRFAPERDDYAALHEVLLRRFRRARRGDAGWALPDLLVVDGGKGQLGVALAAARDAGVAEKLDLCALAKPDDRGEPDRVFLPGAKDPLRLRPNTAELYVLCHARDEAHRFAIAYHRKLRGQRALRSTLDDVEGVGAARRRALLRHFGSLRRLRDAPVDEMARVPGMTRAAAEAVAKFLGARG